jgi:hypothetical protein
MVLIRLIAGLAAAAVAVGAALVVSAALAALLPARAGQGAGILLLVLAPVLAFVWVYRRLEGKGARRRRLLREVAERQEQALERELPQKARAIAAGLGQGGTWQSAALRITGGDTPHIDALQDGRWITVFAARFQPAVAGQVVPATIRPHAFLSRWFSIDSRAVGARPASWDVLAYLPGAWEDGLEALVEEAEKARLAAETARFGL